jgi:RimJ/RimL family protein N-acetyltransferase
MSERIRAARVEDASKLLELKVTLDHETSFMMLEPGERDMDPEAATKQLRERDELSNSVVLVAEKVGRIVGYVEATGGEFTRNRHSAYVVIGVLQTASGRGFGSRLLEAVDAWAQLHGITRLELTVMSHNKRAIALYERLGYQVEGLRKRSIRVHGEYVDELAMAKLLDSGPGA